MDTVEQDSVTESDRPFAGEKPGRRTDAEARLVEAVRADLFPGLARDVEEVGPESTLRIGRYAIIRKLGEGGMGVVFAGYDEQLDRKVAVKLLRRRFEDHVAKRRLAREGQALARLSHPNVVHIYELGEHQGALFVAMEFVVGETLRAWLDDRSERDWRTSAEILVQAGTGLAAAHAAGLVHRDFKPDNVIVGADGRTRVLDFGLVHDAEARTQSHVSTAGELDERELTRTGAILGTPAYMAPEQFAARDCDPRTDQFAFCVVAFEGLFGRRPFPADNVVTLSERVTSGELEPIPDGSKVPELLRAAILRGLSVDPDERWLDMPTLLAEFDRALDPGRPRRRLAWAAGAVAALLSTGLGVWSVWSEPKLCVFDQSALVGTWDDARRAAVGRVFAGSHEALPAIEQALDQWSEQWLASRRSTCEATRVVGDQSDALLDLRSGCLERQRREVTAIVDVLAGADAVDVDRAFELLERLPDTRECEDPRLGETAHPLPSDPEQREPILKAYEQLSRARALGSGGRPDEGDAIAKALRGDELGYLPLKIELQALAAEQALWRQEIAEAVPKLREAIRAAEVARLDELSATLRTKLATYVVGQWGQPELQAAVLDEAETAVARLGRADDTRAVELELARAAWLDGMGEHDAALAAYRDCIDAGRVRGADRVVGGALLQLAQTLARLERLDEAETAFADAKAWVERSRPGSSLIADIELDLGLLELGRGRFDAAEHHFSRARKRYGSIVSPSSVNINRLTLAEAKLWFGRGELEEAERSFVEVAAAATDPRILADAWEALGVVRFYLADFSGSITAYERALEYRLQVLGPEHPDVGMLRANFGESLAALGDHERALVSYAESLRILERALPADHSDLAIPYKGRAKSQLALGDPAGARSDLQVALALHERNPGEALERADVEFSLAQALLELGDRERGLELASVARRRFAELEQTESVDAITRWLDDHR